jgi:hypothetical protein
VSCGRLILILVLAAAVFLALPLWGCSSGPSGPEMAVEDALEAMDALDVDLMASYFTGETREYVISGMAFYLERIDDIEISDVQTEVLSEEGSTATVKAVYEIVVATADRVHGTRAVKTVNLVEVGGEWLIDDLSLIE